MKPKVWQEEQNMASCTNSTKPDTHRHPGGDTHTRSHQPPRSVFFLEASPSVRKVAHSRTMARSGFVPPTAERGMAIACECNSCLRAPRPQAGIVVATSKLATRAQERYKTPTRLRKASSATARHEVTRSMSSGNRQTVYGRALVLQPQLKRVCTGPTRLVVHGYA